MFRIDTKRFTFSFFRTSFFRPRCAPRKMPQFRDFEPPAAGNCSILLYSNAVFCPTVLPYYCVCPQAWLHVSAHIFRTTQPPNLIFEYVLDVCIGHPNMQETLHMSRFSGLLLRTPGRGRPQRGRPSPGVRLHEPPARGYCYGMSTSDVRLRLRDETTTYYFYHRIFSVSPL